MLLAGGALDGVRVLKQETVKLMARNAIGDLNVPMVRSNNPALALEVETFPGLVGTHFRGPDGKPAPTDFETSEDADFYTGGRAMSSLNRKLVSGMPSGSKMCRRK